MYVDKDLYRLVEKIGDDKDFDRDSVLDLAIDLNNKLSMIYTEYMGITDQQYRNDKICYFTMYTFADNGITDVVVNMCNNPDNIDVLFQSYITLRDNISSLKLYGMMVQHLDMSYKEYCATGIIKPASYYSAKIKESIEAIEYDIPDTLNIDTTYDINSDWGGSIANVIAQRDPVKYVEQYKLFNDYILRIAQLQG